MFGKDLKCLKKVRLNRNKETIRPHTMHKIFNFNICIILIINVNNKTKLKHRFSG